MSTNNELISYFDKIYIINLPARLDRRAEIDAQLHKIALSISHPQVFLFPAIRPADAGNFPSVGARGCFSSHLEILKDATLKGYQRILVFEDDLDFADNFAELIPNVIKGLKESPWSMFYGGYHVSSSLTLSGLKGLQQISPSDGVGATHFVGFQAPAIASVQEYLAQIMGRESGDPKGGPMHVDGAYCWYRKEYPEQLTMLAVPELGFQRSSRTDIHDVKWYDSMPLLMGLMSVLRKTKNKFRVM